MTIIQAVEHRIIETNKKVNYVDTQHFGGFITYIKLTFNFWKLLFKQSKNFTKLQFFKILLISFFKSFWWILIKPFGQIFSYKIIIKGQFKSINYKIPKEHKLEKTIYLQLFNIPFFFFPLALTEDDWKRLLK